MQFALYAVQWLWGHRAFALAGLLALALTVQSIRLSMSDAKVKADAVTIKADLMELQDASATIARLRQSITDQNAAVDQLAHAATIAQGRAQTAISATKPQVSALQADAARVAAFQAPKDDDDCTAARHLLESVQ